MHKTPNDRSITPVDRLITEFDKGLRTLFTPPVATRVRPTSSDEQSPAVELDEKERQQAIELMRINHAGEVSAQALYQGQAVTARNEETRAKLQEAAQEETDHLAWCEERIRELGGEPSKLGPLWYSGSFAIGALAGLISDRVSLGFVAETEYQVVKHLEKHLDRLPEADTESRAIVSQMRDDEAEHGANATEAGGVPLPPPVKIAMQLASKVMTNTAGKI